jgi:hypothetical protein
MHIAAFGDGGVIRRACDMLSVIPGRRASGEPGIQPASVP